MLSRAWMEVDLGALVRNATALSQRAGVPLIPMIKADAYGLGAEQVAHALEHLSPMAYGVATIEEGQELREAGIERAIIVFTPLLAEEYEAANNARLTPTLGSREQIEAWKMYGSPYILSVDTGMSRAGVPWREIGALAETIAEARPMAVFTHFHSAELDDRTMSEQLARFDGALAQLPSHPDIIHADSSAAIVRHSRSPWSAVRPGIFMYGVGSGKSAAIQPEPVVYMKGRVVEIRRIEPGDTVSYDATWTARRQSLIATIPLGYADGYPRGASNTGMGLVREKLVPVAGRVTMDMTMLDVTDVGVEIGDVVTMIGNPGTNGAPIDVASVAEKAGISPYELLTGLRNRIRRTYRGQ